MVKRIGILAGMEAHDFPAAFIARINREPGFYAEMAKIDATPESFQANYDVIVDRISHEVPFYRIHLKAAALAGTYVINDPFWFSADDKFFGFSLAKKLGVAVPRTVLLPQHSYIPAIDPQRSLQNLVYPLDWQAITEYVGLPAILKPAEGGGWKNVSRVNNIHELLRDYNQSNTLAMTLQEFIDFDDYVRCICIGKNAIRPIRYHPQTRSYLADKNWMSPALEKEVLRGATAINEALGYDMNSVEFAIKNGVPYAIDFTNPAPDMYRWSVLDDNYEWCVEEMARFAMEKAVEGKPNDGGYNFQRYLKSMRATMNGSSSNGETPVPVPTV